MWRSITSSSAVLWRHTITDALGLQTIGRRLLDKQIEFSITLVCLYIGELCMPRINNRKEAIIAKKGGKYRKGWCKRCDVVASFDAIVTPPTSLVLTLFHLCSARLSPFTLAVVNLGTRWPPSVSNWPTCRKVLSGHFLIIPRQVPC
jgi:hypothetical protein